MDASSVQRGTGKAPASNYRGKLRKAVFPKTVLDFGYGGSLFLSSSSLRLFGGAGNSLSSEVRDANEAHPDLSPLPLGPSCEEKLAPI